MTKIITRICTGKYNHIEIEEEVENLSYAEIDKKIKELKEIQDKHTSDGNSKSPEIVWNEKKCPECGSQLVESIGISPKNNKPYHYIKCINNKDKDSSCRYIKWMDVSSLPETKEITTESKE